MLKPESSRIIHVPLTETVCQAICSVFTASLHSNQCSLLLCGIVHFFLAAFCLLCVHLILSLSYVVLACGYCGYEFVGYCFLNNALHFILPMIFWQKLLSFTASYLDLFQMSDVFGRLDLLVVHYKH